jgi:hypothetical protein
MVYKFYLLAAFFMSPMKVCQAANYFESQKRHASEMQARNVRQRHGDYSFNENNGQNTVHNTQFTHYETYPHEFNIFNREELIACTNKFKEIWYDYSSSPQGLSRIPRNIFGLLYKFIDQLRQTMRAVAEFDEPYLAMGHLLEINAVPLQEGQDNRALCIQSFLCAARNGLPEAQYQASRMLSLRREGDDLFYSSLLRSPDSDREKLSKFVKSSCAEFIGNFVYSNNDLRRVVTEERNLERVQINHNDQEVSFASHVTDLEIANSLIIDTDTDAYDSQGNFLFGIRYGVIAEGGPEYGTKKLSTSKLKNRIKRDSYRGDAAGPLNLEDERKRITKSKFEPEVDSENPNRYRLGGRRRSASVHSITIGFTIFDQTPAQLKQKGEDIGIFLPHLEELTTLFKLYWPRSYASHLEQTRYKKIFAGTCFSHFTLNAHEIEIDGEVMKNTPRGLHRDNNNIKSMTLMFVIKENTQGGDLYFPEYGPHGTVIRLRHNALVCFRGARQAHGVTSISREDETRSSLRISGVAYLKNINI